MLNKQLPFRPAALCLALAGALAASGCSSINDTLSGDKVDYRDGGSKTVKLDVPPDLNQLSGQTRYGQAQPSTVSASSLAAAAAARDPNATQSGIATNQSGDVKLERNGQMRWLSVNQPPEKVWEQVKAFWLEAGFELPVATPAAGFMETNWSENRAKLPQTGIRKLLGSLTDSLYDTGERDQFRTRIERTANGGSEVYISHRGVMEVWENDRKEQTKWVGRPTSTDLEAEMLARLMVKLGGTKEQASAAKADMKSGDSNVAATGASTSATRVKLQADGISLVASEGIDVMWRRVGLALDRAGYTIEERNRNLGTYEIRLAPGTDPTAKEPGFFGRLFGASSKAGPDGLARYRVQITTQGSQTLIKVISNQEDGNNSEPVRRIAKQLVDELS